MTIPTFPEFQLSFKTTCKPSELFTVSSSHDVVIACRSVFEADTIEWVESFVLLCLNRANKIIGFYKVSQGGITGTVADPRVILQICLLCNATGMIVCHNHPSGNLCPSRADENLTQKIKHAAQYFDIRLLDHVILTASDYYSFADEGLL